MGDPLFRVAMEVDRLERRGAGWVEVTLRSVDTVHDKMLVTLDVQITDVDAWPICRRVVLTVTPEAAD